MAAFVIFDMHVMMTSNAHLICKAIMISSLEKYLFISYPHFSLWVVCIFTYEFNICALWLHVFKILSSKTMGRFFLYLCCLCLTELLIFT